MLGWGHSTKASVNKLYDNWFHLKLQLTQSFDVCYESGALNPDRYPCAYTDQKERQNEAHALIFRGRLLKETRMPEDRLPHQKWIFFEHEPPNKVWFVSNLTKYNNLFNVTATFSLDSDVPKVTYLRNCIRNEETHKELSQINFAAKKTRNTSVAWMVSVCKTQSKREDYVKELQKYIGVDVYGKCGPLACGSSRTWLTDQCNRQLLHNNGSYKFYLAFENSLCDDYISEKLWKVTHLDVVPVVLGAADYANIMPRDSFIDVRDFASPKDLAQYLHYLDEHDDLYNQYISNRRSLVCNHMFAYSMPWECRLCKYLHEHRRETKVVHSIDSFWGSRRCAKPSHFFDSNPVGIF